MVSHPSEGLKVSESECVRNTYFPINFDLILKMIVSKSESAKIWKCQNCSARILWNWKVSESESVRTWKWQNFFKNLKVSENGKFRIRMCPDRNVSNNRIVSESSESGERQNRLETVINGLGFIPEKWVLFHFILQVLTLSSCKISGNVLTLGNSNTFRFWHYQILSLSELD